MATQSGGPNGRRRKPPVKQKRTKPQNKSKPPNKPKKARRVQQPLQAADINDAAANPFALPPSFIAALHGDWEEGGVLEFFVDDRFVDRINLTPAAWAVMARLFRAAIDSHSSGAHWLNSFVRTKSLTDTLDEWTLASVPTSQTIYKLVYGLRIALAGSAVCNYNGSAELTEQLAKLVVENRRNRGYRVALPRSRLRLTIDGEAYMPITEEINTAC